MLQQQLRDEPAQWLVTGAAGFIGSHLVQQLLAQGQRVVGLDNFATGHRSNIEAVKEAVGAEAAARYTFIEGDIRSASDCERAMAGADYVLHQAALGSVPRSIENPLASNEVNVDGFLTVLNTACQAKVKRVVYASSSSVYGDHPGLPKTEPVVGNPLSPYAVTKCVNELYAGVFALNYGLETIGLRYFNVFGPRQDPAGAYAAVIPRWFDSLSQGLQCTINGDGETSRDFCFIDNVVQANLLAATTTNPDAVNQAYNIALGGSTTLNQLYHHMQDLVLKARPQLAARDPQYADFRAGDVRHSQADISKASTLLGFQPGIDVMQGLAITADWFLAQAEKEGRSS